MLPVTTLSASILGLVLVYLSMNVIKYRREEQAYLDRGEGEKIDRAIRGQANLTEYAPTGLILILLGELQDANTIALMILAAIFVIGRLMHGYAFAIVDRSVFARFWGMIGTFFGLAGLAVLNIINLLISQ